MGKDILTTGKHQKTSRKEHREQMHERKKRTNSVFARNKESNRVHSYVETNIQKGNMQSKIPTKVDHDEKKG